MNKVTVVVNKTVVTGIPGNMKLWPSFNSYGPFLDGRSYSDGSVRTRKGKFIGRYDRTIYPDGRMVINITI